MRASRRNTASRRATTRLSLSTLRLATRSSPPIRIATEIIKPYLRGQDIDRWYAPWRGFWMIVLKSSSDQSWPWSMEQKNAEPIFASNYPSIYDYFVRRNPDEMRKMKKRADQGCYWWELRPCSYYALFETSKIIYNDITWTPQFSISANGHYINNTAYLLPTSNRWILSVFNAPIGWWFAWRAAQHGKDEALRYFNTFVESYPIPPSFQDGDEFASETVSRLSVI